MHSHLFPILISFALLFEVRLLLDALPLGCLFCLSQLLLDFSSLCHWGFNAGLCLEPIDESLTIFS
jgi:hypothetical protein